MGIFTRHVSGWVNPYTLAVVKEMWGQIRLSTKGRQNIEVATINLKIMGSIGIVSEFDIGIEYVYDLYWKQKLVQLAWYYALCWKSATMKILLLKYF